MAMSPEAQAGYEKALTAAVLKHGTLVAKDASIYGWEDYEYHLGWYGSRPHTPHHMRCELIIKGKPVEDSWNEFMGTFYEGDTTVHGITLPSVSCQCGKIKDRSWRWAANMSEVAEAVFEEAFGKRNDAD